MSQRGTPLDWRPLADGWFEHRFPVASATEAAALSERLASLARSYGCPYRTEFKDGVVALHLPDSSAGYEVMAQLSIRFEELVEGDEA